MAKKKPTSAKKAVPKKPIPAMFSPLLSVVYDPAHPELYLAGMKAAEAFTGKPSDLDGRLEWFAAWMMEVVSPYFDGDHPLRELPDHASQEAREALGALNSIRLIQEALRGELAGASQIMRLAIGWAIDAGILLMRFDVQDRHGQIMALGQKNSESLSTGRQVVQEKKVPEVERLTAEYDRRKTLMGNSSRVKNAIFTNMANDLDPNGKVLKSGERESRWGSMSKLKQLIGHLE